MRYAVRSVPLRPRTSISIVNKAPQAVLRQSGEAELSRLRIVHDLERDILILQADETLHDFSSSPLLTGAMASVKHGTGISGAIILSGLAFVVKVLRVTVSDSLAMEPMSPATTTSVGVCLLTVLIIETDQPLFLFLIHVVDGTFVLNVPEKTRNSEILPTKGSTNVLKRRRPEDRPFRNEAEFPRRLVNGFYRMTVCRCREKLRHGVKRERNTGILLC